MGALIVSALAKAVTPYWSAAWMSGVRVAGDADDDARGFMRELVIAPEAAIDRLPGPLIRIVSDVVPLPKIKLLEELPAEELNSFIPSELC